MKKTYFLFTGLSLAMIACKKDFSEIKDIKETENAVTAAQITCTGNNWQLDDPYYKGSPPLVYQNKVYVFKHEVNRVLIYDGTSWDSIPSSIPFTSDPSFVFTIGNKGYLGSIVFQPSIQPDPYFWEYDFATNKWTSKADYPGPYIHSHSSYFSIGNRGYVVGGLQYLGSYAKSLKATWEYNQATNSWTQKANLPPFISRHAATGFSIGNNGYIVNGAMRIDVNTDLYAKDLLRYDPLTDEWTVKASFPGEARIFTSVFVINERAYAGGGGKSNSSFKDFYKYNPATNSWIKVADAPFYNREGFSINSRGYVIFGNNNSNGLLKYTPQFCYPF